MISACVLIRTTRGRFEEAAGRIKQFEGVKRVFTVLGRYDVVVDLESPDFETLGNSVLRIGKMAGVVFTETLVELRSREG